MQALLQVVSARGLHSATLADIAAQAGVSVGLVQRYFRTKDELLRSGVAFVIEQTEQRIWRIEIEPPVRQYLARILDCILPLDDTRLAELRFWLNFVHVSLTEPDIAAEHRQATSRLIGGIAEALAGAKRRGEVSTTLDVAFEAAALAAFVDGLCLHHASNPDLYPVPQLTAAVDAYLDRLFTVTSPPQRVRDGDLDGLAEGELS